MAHTAAFHEAPVGLVAKLLAAKAFVSAVLVDTIKLRAKMAKLHGLAE